VALSKERWRAADAGAYLPSCHVPLSYYGPLTSGVLPTQLLLTPRKTCGSDDAGDAVHAPLEASGYSSGYSSTDAAALEMQEDAQLSAMTQEALGVYGEAAAVSQVQETLHRLHV